MKDFATAVQKLAEVNESLSGSAYWRIVIDETWSGHVMDEEGTTMFHFDSLDSLINQLTLMSLGFNI